MDESMALRFSIKEWRDAKDWTQDELAQRAGLRRATVSDIEGNRTRAISLDTLERLANALGVEPGYLIVREPRRRGGK